MAMRKRWSCFLIALFCLTGCGKNGTEEAHRKAVHTNGIESQSETGILFSGNVDKLYFYDISQKITYPLCARPNCTHDSEETCFSRIFSRLGSNPLLYDNKLYYIALNEENGKISLMSADLDGENQKELAELSTVPDGMFLYNGKIYMPLQQFLFQGTGSGDYKSSSGIAMVDLETGKRETMFRAEGGMDSTAVWYIKEIYDGKLFFMLDGGGTDYSDVERGYYCLDLETKELETMDFDSDCLDTCWINGKAVFYDGVKEQENPEAEKHYWLYDLETNEKTCLTSYRLWGPGILTEKGYLYIEWDNTEYKRGVWNLYETESGKKTELFSFVKQELFTPRFLFEEENREMIGGFYETKEDGKGWYKISVDDFISGKKNYELMLNYFF